VCTGRGRAQARLGDRADSAHVVSEVLQNEEKALQKKKKKKKKKKEI
jgi:hypothetical protein